MMSYDAQNPPDTAPRYTLWGDKWDMETARNALLHFIHEKELDAECEQWLDKHFPDTRHEG
jgi:hypothetical protein